MSVPTAAGRERPQSLPSARSRGSDGVTVKTLPNTQAQSSQSYPYPRRIISRDDQFKPKKEGRVIVASNKTVTASQPALENRGGSTSIKPHPGSINHVTIKGKETPNNHSSSSVTVIRNSAYKSERVAKYDRPTSSKGDRKPSYGSEREGNQDIEVRTHSHSHHSNGREFLRSNSSNYNRELSNSSSTRPKIQSERTHTHHSSSAKPVPPHTRSSNRVFTSEKYRSGNQPRNDLSVEYFRRSVTEQVLCRVLSNVAREDPNLPAIKQLLHYLNDPANNRSVCRSFQGLWDSLLTLHSIQGREKNEAKHSLALCLSKAGHEYMKADVSHVPHYPDNEFYIWIFEMYEESDSDTRCWLMVVLYDTFFKGDLPLLTDRAQFISTEVQRNLDQVAPANEMFSLLKISCHLAQHHYVVFKNVFMDLIDILIGWSIDTDQSDETNGRIAEVIIELHPYWIEDMVHSKGLTEHFVEDVEMHAKSSMKEEANVAMHVSKMMLLIRTFHTAVVAIGERFSYKRDMNIEQGYICMSVSKILGSINSLDVDISEQSLLRTEATDCIGLLSSCGEDLSTVNSLVNFMDEQIDTLLKDTTRSTIILLSTLSKLISTCDVSKLITLTKRILDMDLTSLESSDNMQVQSAMLNLYRSYFATKDMETIQVTFQKIKGGIDKCLCVLSGEVDVEWSESRADVLRNKERARQLLVFYLTSMSQAAVDTNNLILMYSIEPSMFNFLLKDILLTYGDRLKEHATVIVHIIRLLHLHCDSNKNFIARSNLCAADTTRRSRHNITVSRSSGDNFSAILESMTELFFLTLQNTKGIILLTQWISEIVEQLTTLNPPLLNNILVTTMVTNLLSLDDALLVKPMLLNIAKTLALLVKHSSLSPMLLTAVVDYTLYQLSHESPAVRDDFLHVATLLPVDSFQRASFKELMKKHNHVLGVRRSIMTGCYGSMGVETFRAVANLLFKQYTDGEEIDLLWIQRLLLTADKSSTGHADPDRNGTALDQVMHHTGLLEYWLLWQAADFCVAHRLRTPIGKPLDTFMCIEAAIKQIAADNRIEVSPKCGADTKRVWMLLQFMENLEKALYNAYEGTADQLTTHGKIVKSFFRTNRGTCIGWLTRIRLHILSIASAYGHPATVVRHGYELITDMLRNQSTQTPEFELVLVYLTEAWCQLNCSEAIQGLYEWCKSACNRKLPWLKPFLFKAMSRFEEAAVELKTTLSNILSPQAVGGDSIKLQTRPSPLVGAVNQLCAQQVTNCYTSLQSWEEASKWLKEFEVMKSDNGALVGVDPLGYCDKVLMGDEAAPELVSWSKQQHLTSLWKNSVGHVDHQKSLEEEDKSKLNKLVKLECSSDWPATIQPTTMLSLQSQHMNQSALRIEEISKISTRSHGLPWLLNLLQLTNSEHVLSDYTQSVMIACSREARQTANLNLAKNLMSQLSQTQSDQKSSALSVRIERESAKQVFCDKDSISALERMISISLQPVDCEKDKEMSELVARSTLTAVKWLQADSQHLQLLSEGGSVERIPSLTKLISECSEDMNETPTVPLSDKILGSILQRSTVQCPSLAKTWYHFGNWAYKWGRKSLDNAEQSLSSEEVEQIEGLLPQDLTRQEKEDILAVMSMVQGTFTPADEDLTDDAPDYGDDDLQQIKRRLTVSCSSLTDDTIENLVSLWTVTARRVYTLYEESAKAYFSYLSLCSNNQGSDHYNVTITLRLLRLLVKHAWELKDVLEDELANTPTAPWRSIIPQLFSRLNHPEVYVRQSVSELLARLADDYPHLIVYPAIVGCNQSARQLGRTMSYIESDEDEVESDGIATTTDGNSGLSNCFHQLVDTLSSTNPLLIKEVRTLVNELCRITVLWDEFWLGSLGQLTATASERIKALSSEVERVKNNESLSAAEKTLLIHEKRDTIVKPLIHTIERLSDITGKTAETKHEQWFQETYGHLIEKGLRKLKNPEKDEDLLSDWQPFKQLHAFLHQRSQKRSSHMLKMKDLSSVLASLTDTYIPLPGAVAKSDKQPITLQSVHSTVQILPTKTKPKKLAFLGSDGQKYTYLFKGLEDLHLDERIMQLLNIVNDMLVSKGITDSDCSLYRARNYSVTPLGLRSGLIAWVDGCVPLFSLYKRWQVREAAAQSKPNGTSSTVLRPSEVLYSKLLPLLKPLLEDRGLNPKEVKISDVEKIRKDWPQSALTTATKQLIAETPSHLVAKELWCHSTSANEWWSMTQTYCRSVAVMSAIGYILGLGDRHLDNLLLDLNNGEIVHIDYNVCFDKGKSLRVPERVPFRLTSNVVAAMGATGVEGIFRSACEHTIKSMRLGKETLLTLLEAFVYDPLVDWTVGGETGLAGAFYGGNYAFGDAAKDYRRRKKQMERDITRSMFSIRVTEMKTAWLQNKEEMNSCLAELGKYIVSYSEEGVAITMCTEQVEQCKEMLRYIEDLKKEGGQAISRLTQQFASYQKLISCKEECVKSVHSLSEELVKYSKLHQVAIEAVTGPLMDSLEKEIVSLPTLEVAPGSFTRQYLQSGAQIAQLDECEKLHAQLIELVDKRQQQMLQCRESLLRYGSIVSMFQVDTYSTNHIMGECMQCISHLEQNFSYASCQAVARVLESGTRGSSNSALCAKAANSERALQVALSADINKLEKIVEKCNADPTDISALIGAYEAKVVAIAKYRTHHREEGHRSILFIVLPKIAEITRKCLMMESTASKSEKRLHSLTSRDGDWFLDELAWVTDNLLEYIKMTEQPAGAVNGVEDEGRVLCAPILHKVISGMQAVYAALQDLVLNFQQIILPDILMGLVKEDHSVCDMIDSLNDDVIKGHDLSGICSKLENMLRNIIFGTKGVDSHTTEAVTELRNAFNKANPPVEDSRSMTKGAMLTKVFVGLFERVFDEYSAAMQGLHKLQTPKGWRKIDVIREAGALQLSQYSEKTKPILADLFFVKQLMAMKQFFSIAKRYVSIFTVAEPVAIESYDTLSGPVKSFIADFVRKQILGVASQSAGYVICEHLSDIGLDVDKEIALKDFGATSRVSIDDLCKKGLDRRTQTGTQLSQANSLISNFETAWKKQDVGKRLIRNRHLLEALVYQQKRYLMCYQWLHEDLLTAASSGQGQHNQPTRKEVLTELHKNLSALMSANSSYPELMEKLFASENLITQRLKWNAGANPKLASVLTQFETAQSTRSNILQAQAAIVKDLNTYCHSLLHLETMRTKSQEASNLASKCSQLVARCMVVCKDLEEDEQITEQQRVMISLMSKADRQKTGNAFLGRAHDSVQSHLSSLTTKIKGLKRSVSLVSEKYQSQVSSIQYGSLSAHHKLISEVRAVLKTLAKEEMEDPEQLGCRVQNYLRDYKIFSEQLTNVIKIASNESLTDQLKMNMTGLLSDLGQNIESIFTRLIDIAKPLTVVPHDDGPSTNNNAVEKAPAGHSSTGEETGVTTTTSPPMSFTPVNVKDGQGHGEKVQRDPKTGKAVQERNSYAVSVWRRVKMKLDGRELDPNKKMSVTDQVGYIINEASDIKNLAQMYEGWTSWV